LIGQQVAGDEGRGMAHEGEAAFEARTEVWCSMPNGAA
jgi:hypothetical protein